MSINFLSICAISLHVWRYEFLNLIRMYLFSWGLLCFISYSEHLSVIYNDKNYGSLPYILFIAVQTVELPWIDHNALGYAQNSRWRHYC